MATRKSTTTRKAKPSPSVADPAGILPTLEALDAIAASNSAEAADESETLDKYIDGQRGRIFDAQGIIGAVRKAIWASQDGETDQELVDCQSALRIAHEILEDVAGKLDPLAMRRTVRDREGVQS